MLDTVQLGDLSVSKLILGGNTFSGFSHFGHEKDKEMLHYFTAERIKQTYADAERLGVNTHIGRADHHIMRVLMEYWDEGGTIQWIAQTCPELGAPDRGVRNALRGGAKACFLHGGVMDVRFASGELGDLPAAINSIHDAGLPAGVAGHNPLVHEWAAEHLDIDFHMCCYYNPVKRGSGGDHIAGTQERYAEEDRDLMMLTIPKLDKPVIHYKILAAGRNDPAEAFAFAARQMRPNDSVCVGIYPGANPRMLEEDVEHLQNALEGVQTSAG